MINNSWSWKKAGVLMGLLNAFLLVFYGKLLGASTAYVSSTGGLIGKLSPGFIANNQYFSQTPLGFTFELALMAGVVFGAHLAFRKSGGKKEEFSTEWLSRFGPNRVKRYLFAFFGGILLIFGARLAGGCTSGHILSGWAQLSVSSLLFGIGVFAAGLPAARLIFRRV